MHHRCVVSTACPSCAAPLDFAEGTHAVQCRYCRSHLLVTGRKQVLSYAVTPSLDAQRAVTLALEAQPAEGKLCRVTNQQLYFIPYYRLTGQELRWEREPRETPSAFSSLHDHPQLAVALALAGGGKKPHTREKIGLKDRHVEKNFIACPLSGVGLYSLGVRPAVLRLTLFHRPTLESWGKIVAVGVTVDEARSRGLQTDDAQIVSRTVVGQVLSVIYFPFWVIAVERRQEPTLTIIDAVSQTVVAVAAPFSLYTTLEQAQPAGPRIVGFRPLLCPNCGWDLPVRPDDVVFFCATCHKAWLLQGNSLDEVPCQIIAAPNEREPQLLTYLPLWMLRMRRGQKGIAPFFLPAFRYRRVKALLDFARKLSAQQPVLPAFQGTSPAVHGCYYDQEDAVAFARFALAGEAVQSHGEPKLAKQEQEPCAQRATLLWYPFKRQGNLLIDPSTGLHLSYNLLI